MKNLLIMLFILSMWFGGFSASFAAEVMVGGEAMFTSKRHYR